MAAKEILRGWFDREITEPEQMEASLRYAAVLPTDFLGYGSFTFPWYKRVNDETYFLHFRRTGKDDCQNICLDLGQFADSNTDDERVFISSAWRDFRITRKGYRFRNGRKGHLIGEGSRENSVNNFNPLYIKRRRPIGHWGIYVSEELRRQKVGTALISAARIILDQIGARALILEEIEKLEKGSPRRCFHESLGGRIFDLHEDFYIHTHERVLCGKVAYPTRATKRCPYRFE